MWHVKGLYSFLPSHIIRIQRDDVLPHLPQPLQNKKTKQNSAGGVQISWSTTIALPSFFMSPCRARFPHEGLSLPLTSKSRMTWRWNWTARAWGKVKPSRWWNVKEGRTAEIKTDSWWMSLDAYWQAKFAACLVRCDTFGPPGAAAGWWRRQQRQRQCHGGGTALKWVRGGEKGEEIRGECREASMEWRKNMVVRHG